ncbi:MAG: peptide-methionine (S)-S-oxide reductase MsrA [Bdellovibrionota bacterium]
MATEKATLAAGCFWGVQHLLDEIPGVISTKCGYIGGQTNDPTYKQICEGDTNHAEAVEVTSDPDKVSYETILSYFWRLHDPTQLNRQGPDHGTQYRSAIFYHSPEQKEKAEKSKAEFDKSLVFTRPAVTQIVPAPTFYKAEEYHQDYFNKNGGPICHIYRPR